MTHGCIKDQSIAISIFIIKYLANKFIFYTNSRVVINPEHLKIINHNFHCSIKIEFSFELVC